jgi:hypothetical protein
MYKKILKNMKKQTLPLLYKTETNLIKTPHFIFSAENPMYPENHIYNLTHEKVVSMLKGKGYQVEEARGHYGKPERSIIVGNVNPNSVKHLQKLARGLGQESSIVSDSYNHEMHFHGGENEGLHIKGQGTTIHKRKPDDHFTEMKDGTSFSHIFNFDEAHPKESSAFKQPSISTKKSEIDFVKSEPNHPLVNPHPDTKLIHFSTTEGLKEIDPNFQGARIKDASSKRGKPEHPVSFFYLEGAKPEALVTSGASRKYTARLGNRKVYDLGTDPDHIRHGLREASKNRQINPGSFTRDELDSAIKAKGYHGVYNSAHESEDMRHVVGMYHPTPVEKEVPFHPRDAERATDAAHEQHHSLQKASRLFLEDIEKGGVTSPSKFTGIKQLKQIQQDNGLGAGGKEYDMDEVKNSLNERGNSVAAKMVAGAGKKEKEMAAQAQAPASVNPMFPPPMPNKRGATITPISSHNQNIRAIADSYAASRGLKLNHNIPQSKVDPENAAKIADAYHTAQHSPNDPHVKSAYDALINETKAQYQHMLNNGLKVTKMQAGQENPYKTSKDLFNDIKNNNHIAYFPTEQGYGSGDQTSDHPMLQPTEHMDAEGKPMLANDLFRVVHDYFGHAKEGNGFGANGEEGAWKHHMQMYSPMAQKALTAETRGQNSWVNYGPHGEENRKNPANTRYADQKATILPDWAHQHGEQSVYSSLKKREIIMMKGAMQRLAPYNPDKHISAEDHKATENWTSEGDDQDARSNVPEMHANAKVRALHKMTGMTQVRKHPKTGERMFLLHRGMGNSEFVQNHQAGVSNYAPGTLTSWTPKYSVAKDFSGDHKEGAKQRVVSAWIPESHIHNVPNQTMIPDENAQFRNEHEVIVNHQGPQPHAHKDVVLQARNPRLFLDNKINMKGLAEHAQKNPFDINAAVNDQAKRSIRAEEYKRNKFGKREIISMKTLAKGDISSKIKNGVTGLAIAAAALSPMNSHQDQQPEPPAITQEAPAPVNKRKERILSSIMDVESSNGKNTKHKSMPLASLHRGESAYGNYGLMPLIIRETIKKNPSLKAHAAAQNLTGDKMHEYMNKNPGLEKQIAEAHYDRLAKQFGDNPQKIGYAWLNGVAGTHKAIKENRPLDKHFYVKRILKAYKTKKQGLK